MADPAELFSRTVLPDPRFRGSRIDPRTGLPQRDPRLGDSPSGLQQDPETGELVDPSDPRYAADTSQVIPPEVLEAARAAPRLPTPGAPVEGSGALPEDAPTVAFSRPEQPPAPGVPSVGGASADTARARRFAEESEQRLAKARQGGEAARGEAQAAMGELAGAVQQQGQLAGEAAGERAELTTRLVKEARDQIPKEDKILQGLENEYRQLASETEGVDPNRKWASASTGSKVMAGLAIALGGIGQAMQQAAGVQGARNSAIDIIDQAIDRDIEAQKSAIEQRRVRADSLRTMYGMALRRFGNERSARDAVKAMEFDRLAAELERQAAPLEGTIKANQLIAQAADARSAAADRREQLAQNELASARAGVRGERALDIQQGQLQLRAQAAGQGPAMPVVPGAKLDRPDVFASMSTRERELSLPLVRKMTGDVHALVETIDEAIKIRRQLSGAEQVAGGLIASEKIKRGNELVQRARDTIRMLAGMGAPQAKEFEILEKRMNEIDKTGFTTQIISGKDPVIENFMAVREGALQTGNATLAPYGWSLEGTGDTRSFNTLGDPVRQR